jgi:hypothetical protein
VAVEEVFEGGDGGDVVFAGGGEVAADVGEPFGAVLAAEAARDLAVELGGAEIPVR